MLLQWIAGNPPPAHASFLWCSGLIAASDGPGGRRMVVQLSGSRLTVALVAGLISVLIVGSCFAVWAGRHLAGSSDASATIRAAESTAPPAGARTKPARGQASAGPSTNLTVQLTSMARDRPKSADVQSAFQRYFDAINQHDYQAWTQSVASDLSARQSGEQWRRAYTSTTDSGIWVEDVLTDPLRATVTFTSEQTLSLAPPDLQSTCIMWSVTYALAGTDGQLRIGSSQAGPLTKAMC